MSAVDTIRGVSALAGPYVGLNFYTQENAVLFFGRDRERTVLISNLRAARLTLLYAKSGTGKSSLLRAGVEAMLAELARHSIEQRGTARNIPVVFSSWRDDPTAELMAEIHEAIGPFLTAAPPAVRTSDRLEAAIEAASRATGATLLVILDQFEEYLLYRSRETRERPFADELATCINRADLRVKFLISIREDAYFALGDLFKGRITNVYGNYFHLEHLTREAAREAIEKPIASFNELHPERAAVGIEPGLVDAVLDQFKPDQLALDQGGAGRLAGGDGAEPRRDEIEASYLQLVMKRLWDVEQEKHSATLRLETLEELGGAQRIVRTHVDRTLGDLPDDERSAAVALLHHLVTPSRTKIALTASDLAEYIGSGTREINALLERLADSKTRILRPVPPPHGQNGETRYEISHDLLAPAILDWDRRQKAVRLEQEKEAAERQARAERRRARRSRYTAIAAVVVALLVVATVVTAYVAVRREAAAARAEVAALRTSRLAQSEGMAAEAINVLPVNGPVAMLLSLQAYEIAPTLQAESALIQTVDQPLNHLLAEGGQVDSVAFSPDGRTLAAGDTYGDVDLWTVATGRTRTLAEGIQVQSVAFSRDGRTLAAGDVNGDVVLWDPATGRRTRTLAEGSTVDSVAFSPDGRTLAVGSDSGVGVWNVATGRRTATLAEGSQLIFSVAFSPDGRTLAVGDIGGDVGLWNVATGRRITALAEGSPVFSVAFSPDGGILAVGDFGGDAGLWNVVTRQRIATFAQGATVTSVAFTRDGRTLAVGDANGRVGLWDAAAGQRPSTLTEGSPVHSVAFSPDGRTLAVGDEADNDVGVWDVATGRRTRTLAEGSTVVSVAFSPDGGRTLAVGSDKGVGVWDVATGRRTRTLAEGRQVASVAFSPDGRTLTVVESFPSHNVGLWDVVTERRTATLTHSSSVSSVAFSPGGQTLVTGDDLGNVGIWDAADGQQLATLSEVGSVTSLAFSSNGPVLAIGGLNGDVVLLREDLTDLNLGYFRQLVCGKVQGNLTQAQWHNYAPGQPYQKTCP